LFAVALASKEHEAVKVGPQVIDAESVVTDETAPASASSALARWMNPSKITGPSPSPWSRA
jgi:hypothetical protein